MCIKAVPDVLYSFSHQVCLTKKNIFVRAVIFYFHIRHDQQYGATFASTVSDMLATGALYYLSDEWVSTRGWNEGMDEGRAESV